MSSAATITYFKGRGLAEAIRFLLAAVGEPFENKGLSAPEELDALRAAGALSFNQLPLLEIDGLQLVQSASIARYIARKHHIIGSDSVQQYKIEMVHDTVRDFVGVALGIATADAGYPAKVQAVLDKYLPLFERYLVANTESDTFLVGSSLTLADILLAEALLAYVEVTAAIGAPTPLTAYPRLKRLYDHVLALPGVAAYLASPLRYPLGDAVYWANVNTVLRR